MLSPKYMSEEESEIEDETMESVFIVHSYVATDGM